MGVGARVFSHAREFSFTHIHCPCLGLYRGGGNFIEEVGTDVPRPKFGDKQGEHKMVRKWYLKTGLLH